MLQALSVVRWAPLSESLCNDKARKEYSEFYSQRWSMPNCSFQRGSQSQTQVTVSWWRKMGISSPAAAAAAQASAVRSTQLVSVRSLKKWWPSLARWSVPMSLIVSHDSWMSDALCFLFTGADSNCPNDDWTNIADVLRTLGRPNTARWSSNVFECKASLCQN